MRWCFLFLMSLSGEAREVAHQIGENPMFSNGLWRILVGIVNLGFATDSYLDLGWESSSMPLIYLLHKNVTKAK